MNEADMAKHQDDLEVVESAWQAMEDEFGMLSSLEVSQLVNSRSPNPSYASEQRARGSLLAVDRDGELRYPGFQFDEGVVRPTMADLIHVADKYDKSEGYLALWLLIPTGYFDGERPVDRFEYPDTVIEVAIESFGAQR